MIIILNDAHDLQTQTHTHTLCAPVDVCVANKATRGKNNNNKNKTEENDKTEIGNVVFHSQPHKLSVTSKTVVSVVQQLNGEKYAETLKFDEFQ